MKSPFPGMDPYLEPNWGDVHASLIIYSRDHLQRQLPQPLFARVEERVFLEAEASERRPMYPDVRVVEQRAAAGVATATGLAVAEPVVVHYGSEAMTETFIEIVDASSGNKVITVIEILSASNKFAGDGQDLYRQKQKELREGRVSLVEIDLLREGKRVLNLPLSRIPRRVRTTYQVCVHRGWKTLEYEIYPVPLRQRLPAIRIPLREKDQDVRLDLQEIVDLAYENGRYGFTLNYTEEAEPPLAGEDATWAEGLLRAAGKRK